MQILITNIGNRNIIYNDKLYSELERKGSRPDTSLSFREWTKQLLDNFDNEKDCIKLNILDAVLSQPDFKPDKVIMVVSNQQDTTHYNQDTLYEGEIIKRILIEQYQIADVELKELTDDVTNENYLMQFYQKLYLELLKNYHDANFVFCDAGGTGQQKTASKIMAEFMLPDNQWKIVYPKKDGNVETKSQIEYRNIINKEQAIALVRKSQYEAALNTLGGNINVMSDNKTLNLIAFAHFRKSRVLEKTKKIWENNNIDNKKNPILISAVYPKKRNCSEKLFNLFQENPYLFLSEALMIAYHDYLIGNYRESVLNFAVFYEYFINKCLKKIEAEIKNVFEEKVNKRDSLITKYIGSSDNPFPKTKNYVETNLIDSDRNPDFESVPVAIHIIAEQDFLSELQPLAKILLPYLDFTYSPYIEKKQNSVRDVRNKLAHKGKYIDATILKEELPYYEELIESCLKEWGLPQEDIYEQMNKMIEEQIRNQ